ncbi:prostate stem cell antigen-like [Erpetoichthys calabaricus]|uniref:prostate stem cell antigen-like n=1 Tax=Erpetoichthys calabaricus TaxID=27687 RepID=UPI00109F3CF5|nr:prostate stem cell antigen-like [Erpetoichthys calabaricus]
MKAHLLVLILGCLSVKTAYGLQCYSCTLSLSNTDCNKNTQNCTIETSCYSTVTSALGISSITKGCGVSTMCSSNINVVVASTSTTCCSTNLCNVNSSSTFSLNVLLLAACAVALFMSKKITE